MNEHLLNQFIGPKAENIDLVKELVNRILDWQKEWRSSQYKEDGELYPTNVPENEKLRKELDLFLKRAEQNLPYFHPRYAAQMLKDPSIPTILGYLTFMMSNPNNHAYEGGPVTTEMEMDVTDMLLTLAGYKEGWGHLTSGGSLANMEALWAARDYYGEGTVYFSEVSHYSWKRICTILNISDYKEIPVDKQFRMNKEELEKELKEHKAMMVVANLGSTGTGSIDDIEALLQLKEKYEFHLHIDAAYGGFARAVIIDGHDEIVPYTDELSVCEYTYKQLEKLSESDSLTIDPHKLGMISYGAGAVIYKNEKLRDVILNTAPYTYHKLDKPNIGMFSLEGSRPGAMAAACYLTYKTIPLNNTGVGSIIEQSLRASKKFYELIAQSDLYANLHEPDLDINCFYRKPEEASVEALNSITLDIYKKLSVEAENPEFIFSKFVLPPEVASRALPSYRNENQTNVSTLRTVFMKHWGAMNDFYYVQKMIISLENAIG